MQLEFLTYPFFPLDVLQPAHHLKKVMNNATYPPNGLHLRK